LLQKSMKTLFMLFSLAFLAVIVQGGEESGKKVEPLPCKDRGSKASCNRYMKKDNFQELCKENRRIGRYLCCKTCAEKLGVEVDENGKFKDFGTFTYYEPTCPALEDRGNHTICEMIKHGSEVYKCDQSEAQAACAKTCNLSAVANWDNSQAAFTASQGHSFAKTLEHVVGTHASVKFLAYNNVPPGIPNVKTKSNSKGVIILSTAADSAAWVVHTIPGFPTAKTPYAWPASETARGHLLICLTISKSQINAIAASLLLAQPVIHYNDIPETETAGMPYLKKLTEGKTRVMPPYTSRRTIRTKNGGAPVTVHIYSKSETSKYGKHKQKVPERHIRLLKSPGVINGHNTNIEADDTNWAVSDPGSVICHVDKPYFARSKDDENDLSEPVTDVVSENCEMEQSASELNEELDRHVEQKQKPKQLVMLVQIEREKPKSGLYVEYTAEMKFRVNEESVQINKARSKDDENDLSEPVTDVVSENCEMEQSASELNEELDRHVEQKQKPKQLVMLVQIEREKPKSGLYVEYTAEMKFRVNEESVQMAIVYKAPGQNTGKIILASAAGNWDDGAAPLSNNAGHSFAATLEHVVQANNDIKFLAYNNVPPSVPNVKTKSNSKGVIIVRTTANVDSAAWVVHTIPGFPTAKTPYTWPAAENARGHLLICLTISESQINAIAASLLLVQPMIHYNDIPETETAGMPYFKKLAEGQTPIIPPFTSKRSIRTQNPAAPVTVHIYSKSESSKYGKVPERHIRLLKSPGVINGHNTNIEADDTNWAVSDPGSVICHVDKPYFAVSKDIEYDLSEPVTDVVSENCEMEESASELNEELDRHVEQKQKPKQLVMLVQIEREKPKSGSYVEYTAEMKFRVNEESVQMYKPKLKKTVNVADAGMHAVRSFIMKKIGDKLKLDETCSTTSPLPVDGAAAGAHRISLSEFDMRKYCSS
ncbi:Deoxyribonuclease-2-alpha, partial [Trichinella nelsoni]